jgi:glycosyltransferase involved in cell wall biosynthesis
MKISVIVPTHNPDPGRLQRTLLGLRAQSLPPADWEVLLVNNASTRFPAADFFIACALENFSIIIEPELGLTAARRRGLSAAHGEIALLVDDDNLLAPDYLAVTVALFAAHPRVGAAGGRSRPEFAVEPEKWTREFFPLLALRDLGDAPQFATSLRPNGSTRNEYPACAPIGAGMALRRAAWEAWLHTSASHTLSDRRGTALSSSGDNEIVFQLMIAGWSVAYFPTLILTHLIPAGRLEPAYLAQLNRGIQRSWMQVLALHEANPWPPLTPAGARLRQFKAWFTHRVWSSPAARIRWQGACGNFDGRTTL